MPIDLATARQIARSQLKETLTLVPDSEQELRDGYFFGYRSLTGPIVGSNGVIINKQSGHALRLGSAFPIARDLDMYDRGYQFELYDLVVIGVHHYQSAVDFFLHENFTMIEAQFEHGCVWRVPRPLTRSEIEARLASLPYVFAEVKLYFMLEALERARENKIFEFLTLAAPHQNSAC